MAKQHPPSLQPIPSTAVENHNSPVDSIETARVELKTRATNTTRALPENPAPADDRYYARHWGINE